MEISSDVWVAGLIRRAEIAGANDTSTRRARLWTEAFGLDGERRWIEPVESEFEAELDAYVERQRGYDPDIWVVEIEDRQGRAFLEI